MPNCSFDSSRFCNLLIMIVVVLIIIMINIWLLYEWFNLAKLEQDECTPAWYMQVLTKDSRPLFSSCSCNIPVDGSAVTLHWPCSDSARWRTSQIKYWVLILFSAMLVWRHRCSAEDSDARSPGVGPVGVLPRRTTDIRVEERPPRRAGRPPLVCPVGGTCKWCKK